MLFNDADIPNPHSGQLSATIAALCAQANDAFADCDRHALLAIAGAMEVAEPGPYERTIIRPKGYAARVRRAAA